MSIESLSTRPTRRRITALATTFVVLAALGVALLARTASSSAAASTVSDVSLAWGLNGEQGGGAFFGGCNFLSAGKAGDAGSSRLWTEADGFYSTQSGNVTVEKPDAAGNYGRPTWATKCQDPNGTAVTAGSTSSLTKNRVVFAHGSGAVDPAANTASIHWTGSFTSVFYGGMTYWSATDPTLTVKADGTGTLTATASGYGADMNDTSKWVTLTPRTVTLANLHDVKVTGSGFTVTPDYLGVSVTSSTTPQAAKSSTNEAYWGSFPQDFVDFQILTGQSSYWYTSGGSRDAAKPTTPLTVAYTAPGGGDTTTPGGGDTTTPGGGDTITSSPTYHPTVTIDDQTVTAGGAITFTASGFAPGEKIGVEVHSDPVTLTTLTADSSGAVSGSDSMPASVPAGAHHLILTGQSSHATAQVAFTVVAAASCALTNGVKGGSLVWGFKKSFRSYVASGSGNSITATTGAKILNQDLAVAGKASSGTFLWPFKSSSAYTSPSSFTVQYGGKVEFKYPSHYFDIWIANPKIVVSGNSGVLYADVSLTVTAPGQAPSTSAHSGEELATISLSGTSPVSDSKGITRTLHTAIADVDSFSFNGNAFYQKGEALDDATVLLSGCTGTSTALAADTSSTSSSSGTGLDNDPNLVPALQFRPSSLASTGSNMGTPLLVAALLLVAGAGLVVAGRRRPMLRTARQERRRSAVRRGDHA